MLWLWWKLYHDWVVPRTTQKHWNLKETQSLGETRCKKFWDHFDEYYSHSPRNVKQVSGKWRSIAWTIQVKNSLTAKSLRYEIWGPVPWREWKIAAMRPRQSIVYCQKYVQAQKKTQLHSVRPRKSEQCRLHPQYNCGKESLWSIREQVCIWSASETLTLLSWTPWGYRGILDGQRRGADKRRSHSACQRIGLIRDIYASWRNTRRSSLGKLCEDHGYTHHWTSVSSKMAGSSIAM